VADDGPDQRLGGILSGVHAGLILGQVAWGVKIGMRTGTRTGYRRPLGQLLRSPEDLSAGVWANLRILVIIGRQTDLVSDHGLAS
jgi:hypothetical protein